MTPRLLVSPIRCPRRPRLAEVDGRELYGDPGHAQLPLLDGLHPDAATHVHMGERFAELALRRPFGRQP